ncbi:hypothetical protein F5890DRAFT_694771 [Lentinula detonsa]|uniref:RRM domain-containing protein n=1 Tax=Lentinula detonsa TaxID=2804962 RepID=A0AA38PRQ6_9AGAR|nr:hypothetical protein F5890DRAFT_694771 [Lentinula detonsa]
MSTSTLLGKRKEREEDDPAKQHGSTLFVSNLPYTATSTDLQTLFSDIAPVRSAFVVTESGTGVSKGVGYVSFSIKEDAQAAFDKISTDGLNLVGRSLRVQWADSKPKEKGEKVKKEKKYIPPPNPKIPNDPLAIRIVVVSGLPSNIDAKVLWKKFRKCEGAEKVDWPIQFSGQADTAHVLFSTAQNALDAVNKLHAHVFKGNLLSVGLKKRLDNLTKPAAGPHQASSTAAPSRAARLIVRNLPFNITQQDLRAIFLPYGPIYSIHIPTENKSDTKSDDINDADGMTNKTSGTQIRTRGFAFVWMNSKKDAERAMEGCNGSVIRAGMAENMISDKQKRKKQRRVERKVKEDSKKKDEAEEEEVKGKEGEREESDGDENNDKNPSDERVIAVDWALSKDKWQEEKAKIATVKDDDVEMANDAASGSESSSDSGDGSISDEESEEEEEGVGLHNEGESESGSGSEYIGSDDDEEEDEAPVKPQLPAPEAGTTLFVRNVPFTATEDEFRILFRAFGPLRYARITLDPETGRSRGTGFACFWNKEDADKVITQSDLLRAETGSLTEAPKQNPFKLPSILTPDPSSSLARSLVLQGRTLDVVRAVTRDQAGKLKEEGERRREKADKRNMYLLREGVILPNSPAASLLSPADLERRASSFNARKNLLKANPSLYISKMRLSIRQIPIFVTERMLRRLAVHAVKSFNREVKNGERKGLTDDELLVEPEMETEVEGDANAEEIVDKKNRKRGTFGRKNKSGLIKQAKLVRQQGRVDPITGKGRSKGYGFLEMHTHADALRVLRWANNNASVGDLWEGWWKEELEGLLEGEKNGKFAKESENDAEKDKDMSRTKRIRTEIEKLEDGESAASKKKSRGTLIVEFSIENVQVVQRRKATQDERRKAGPTQKSQKTTESRKDSTKLSHPPKKEESIQHADSSPKKKRKLENAKAIKEEGDAKESEPKAGQTVGFMIGRKRKERRQRK